MGNFRLGLQTPTLVSEWPKKQYNNQIKSISVYFLYEYLSITRSRFSRFKHPPFVTSGSQIWQVFPLKHSLIIICAFVYIQDRGECLTQGRIVHNTEHFQEETHFEQYKRLVTIINNLDTFTFTGFLSNCCWFRKKTK